MPGLLDLPDYPLLRIAYFLNPESSLPLSSWKPYWDNSPSPLNRKATRDLRAFRATARRIRRTVKLRGQFLHIETGEAMVDWKDKADDDMKRAITRLHFACDWEISRLRLSTAEEVKERVATSFADFWELIQQLPNLVELVVTYLPGCVHNIFEGMPGHSVRRSSSAVPPGFQLPKINSLSLDMWCPGCGREHGPDIVGPMVNIEALQLRLGRPREWNPHDTHQPNPQDEPDDLGAGSFAPYVRRWKAHCGFAAMPVRNLNLYIWQYDVDKPTHCGTFAGISEAFPHLTDLASYSVDMDSVWFKPWEWKFAEVDQGGDELTARDSPWDDILKPIYKLKQLTTLELPMRPCYHGRERRVAGHLRTIPHDMARRLVLPEGGHEGRRVKASLEKRVQRSHGRSRLAAVKLLVANIPSLRRGWLWDEVRFDHSNCTASSPCLNEYTLARCGWEVKETGTGETQVVMDRVEHFVDRSEVGSRI